MPYASQFSGYWPCALSVTVERRGLQKAATTITLTVGQIANLNIPLSLGSETVTLTVNAESAAIPDTETSNLDYSVQSKQVDDLPLNGRNPYGLASLAPCITRGAVVAAETNNFESNGGVGGNDKILLDGISIIVCCQGQPAVTPSVEYVNQFKVVTNNPPAQYGRTSGAVLKIATKSGTNSLHGDVCGFLRNDKLDALRISSSVAASIPTRDTPTFAPRTARPSRQNFVVNWLACRVLLVRLCPGSLPQLLQS